MPYKDRQTQLDYMRTYRLSHPEIYKNQNLKRKGTNLHEFQQVLRKQANQCPICKIEYSDRKVPVADHCHVTKLFRSVICKWCNSMLGFAEDNIRTLENAIEYLKEKK